ncbi:MAG: transglycosylase domain-containing protein [Deltaproteobacteria bacterium]|nr:transglycosylase domain-containing protein [Deltaproteobacteria bacterium]
MPVPSSVFAKKRVHIAGFILIVFLSTLLWLFIRSLPDVRPLKDPQYNMKIMVSDWRGRRSSFVLGPRNPLWTSLSQIPPTLKWAVIVAEDDTFYQHRGFNFSAMRDALWEDIKRWRPVRGGSTITQQLAKNLYLSKKKSLFRKLKEAAIARRLERHLSKDRILELYLNVIECGPRVYGVGEGSRYYFRKPPIDLNFFESVLLAAIIPSPKRYYPLRHPQRAMKRYKKVLLLMRTAKLITFNQYEIARAVQLNLDPWEQYLYFSPLWEDKERNI